MNGGEGWGEIRAYPTYRISPVGDDVIPAKAGIHSFFTAAEKRGFPPSRE